MPRIRSVHPSLFTDESYMTASMAAKVLIIGLWTEASDAGVFEWKPIVLKARLFPADAVDVAALLAELEALRFVRRFEVRGKPYGAIRNFRRFQRPKAPTPCKILPPEWQGYVGLSDQDSEGPDQEYPRTGEVLPQDQGGHSEGVEQDRGKTSADGVGVGGKEESKNSAAEPLEPEPPREPSPAQVPAAAPNDLLPIDDLRAKLLACLPADCSWPIMVAQDLRPIFAVLQAGADLDADVLPVLRLEASKAARAGRKLGNWGNVSPHVLAHLERKRQASTLPQALPRPRDPAPDDLRARHLYAARAFLTGDFGTRFNMPAPGEAGCPIPDDVLEQARAQLAAEATEAEAERARRAEYLKTIDLSDFGIRH